MDGERGGEREREREREGGGGDRQEKTCAMLV